jgi:hypothetical protein
MTLPDAPMAGMDLRFETRPLDAEVGADNARVIVGEGPPRCRCFVPYRVMWPT